MSSEKTVRQKIRDRPSTPIPAATNPQGFWRIDSGSSVDTEPETLHVDDLRLANNDLQSVSNCINRTILELQEGVPKTTEQMIQFLKNMHEVLEERVIPVVNFSLEIKESEDVSMRF
jgi:hypothetical protein